MILYHLDRQNTFPSDVNKQLLFPDKMNNIPEAHLFFQNIYPHGISRTGIRYLNSFEIQTTTLKQSQQTCENFRIYTIEYAFEIVRLLHFPHLPSRFTSLFACPDASSIKDWYERLKNNQMDASNASVKVIETSGTTFTADTRWRDAPLILETDNKQQLQIFNPFAYHELAKQYWSGKPYDDNIPHIEILCELPVMVLESIPLTEFLNCHKH